jgi:hypothetical protein
LPRRRNWPQLLYFVARTWVVPLSNENVAIRREMTGYRTITR